MASKVSASCQATGEARLPRSRAQHLSRARQCTSATLAGKPAPSVRSIPPTVHATSVDDDVRRAAGAELHARVQACAYVRLDLLARRIVVAAFSSRSLRKRVSSARARSPEGSSASSRLRRRGPPAPPHTRPSRRRRRRLHSPLHVASLVVDSVVSSGMSSSVASRSQALAARGEVSGDVVGHRGPERDRGILGTRERATHRPCRSGLGAWLNPELLHHRCIVGARRHRRGRVCGTSEGRRVTAARRPDWSQDPWRDRRRCASATRLGAEQDDSVVLAAHQAGVMKDVLRPVDFPQRALHKRDVRTV